MKAINIILTFIVLLFFIGCNKNEEKTYPIDIKIEDFASSKSCNWQNLKPDTLYLINSAAELSEYFPCQEYIDFVKYSLLVVLGKEKNGIYELTKQLTQTSQDEYEFKVNVILEDTIATPNWIVSVLIPKLSDKAQIQLKPQILLPVNKEILVGEWELVKYVDLATSTFTTKPDSIRGNNVINFYDSPISCLHDSSTFCAHSLANSIGGDYELTSNGIKFINLRMTLVYYPAKWNLEFEDALFYNYKSETDYLVKIERDTHVLYIFYSQSQKIMLFNKIG